MKSRRIDLGGDENGKKAKTEHKEPEKKMTADDFMAAVGLSPTTKEAKPKNGGLKTLDPPGELKKVVDEIISWKQKEKEAYSERVTREAEIIEYVKPIQEKEGFENDYQKSYKVSGVKGEVTYVSADRFTTPKDEEILELKDALNDRFDEFVNKEVTMVLKSSVLSDKGLMNELREILGSNAPKFFEAQVKWSIADGFDKKRFTLSKKIFEKVSKIISQAKPSVR